MTSSRFIVSDLALQAARAVRLVVFDFDGVFTDNKVVVSQDGIESVVCNRSDGLGLQALARVGIDSLILSTETNPVVLARAKKLRITCIQGCPDKGAALDELLKSRGLHAGQVAFVGNDVNDLPCLKVVGFPIITHDAHPDVHPYAIYRTIALGGNGAVREVCDLLVWIQGESRGESET